MGDPFGIEMAKVKQEELLREADRRRIARSLWKFRRGEGDEEGPLEGVKVRWGLVGDEPAVADLLELNGLAHALYRGAGELARELGVHEVVVTASRARYPGRAGYRRRGRGWRLDVRRLSQTDSTHGPLHGPLKS